MRLSSRRLRTGCEGCLMKNRGQRKDELFEKFTQGGMRMEEIQGMAVWVKGG